MPDDRADAAICGIILAAGASTRMGRAKQRLPFHGKPLLQHVIDAAAAAELSDIIVVLGHSSGDIAASLRLPERTRVVVNAEFATGLASSLRRGLGAAADRARAAAILLGDEPSVAATTIDTVLGAWRASEAPIARAVYRTGDGLPVPGHPVVIDRALWRLVDDLRGDEGLRAIVRAHPEWTLDVALGGPPPADIDTPGEYRAAGGDAAPDR